MKPIFALSVVFLFGCSSPNYNPYYREDAFGVQQKMHHQRIEAQKQIDDQKSWGKLLRKIQ